MKTSLAVILFNVFAVVRNQSPIEAVKAARRPPERRALMLRPLRVFTTVFLIVISCAFVLAQSSDVPTIGVTSGLVFLDVTVLDKKGRPVVKGLTKDDFLITEDKKPQRVFSFEARRRMWWAGVKPTTARATRLP